MNRRQLLKAFTAMIAAAGALVRPMDKQEVEREPSTCPIAPPKVMSVEQWSSFHKKHWPPRYD